MFYKNKTHEANFRKVLYKMKKCDCYHQAAAYLIAMDLYNYRYDVFDFETDRIKPYTSLKHGWQTSSSMRTTRLMQNLWNGCVSDYPEIEEETDLDTVIPDVSDYYAVDYIFSNLENARCYWQAIKIRFEMEDEFEHAEYLFSDD